MKRQILRNLAPVVPRGTLVVLVVGVAMWAGCDARTWSSGGNRVEALNDATKRVIDTLKAITDEATAKAHQATLEGLTAEIKEIRKGIDEAASKSTGSGGVIANHRPWKFQAQMETSVQSQLERIREASKEAGEIVDKALEGAGF